MLMLNLSRQSPAEDTETECELVRTAKTRWQHYSHFLYTLWKKKTTLYTFATLLTRAPTKSAPLFLSAPLHPSVRPVRPGTHQSCLLEGRQSLLDAVTPMAICITVMYFWYFILSFSSSSAPHSSSAASITFCVYFQELSLHRWAGTGARSSNARLRSRGVRGIVSVKSAISTERKLPEGVKEECCCCCCYCYWCCCCCWCCCHAAATHVCSDSLISLELRIDWLIHAISVSDGTLLLRGFHLFLLLSLSSTCLLPLPFVLCLLCVSEI